MLAVRRGSSSSWWPYALAVSFLVYLLSLSACRPSSNWLPVLHNPTHVLVDQRLAELQKKCDHIRLVPSGPDYSKEKRTLSDRYQEGTPPVLIKNATIWVGLPEGQRRAEVLVGSILIEGGVIREILVGTEEAFSLSTYENITIFDAKGAWVTPGIVDMHSHIGVYSAPLLAGALDGNPADGIVTPWMRVIDALNTHDDSYALTIAGGVTSSLVLPGSGNTIGGQGAVIKLRPTLAKTPDSLLLESPFSLNSSLDAPPGWRHVKHAFGENPSTTLPGGTRMDTVWSARQAYTTATQLKKKQDTFCQVVAAGRIPPTPFPEDLRWEALVDVLRGRAKVHTHIYEAVDLSAFVQLSKEFNFTVAAFHHAHEAYLVPDLLRQVNGPLPALAMFGSFARYKREAYRHSEFAPAILDKEGFPVVMKSDHAAINSRYVLHEAQQAHHYGLPSDIALASVITTPARVLGLNYRIGYIRQGYDADVVIWDSHPLALGATPSQVFIDGIAQIATDQGRSPELKPSAYQTAPKTPNFDTEAEQAIAYDGTPPLEFEHHSRVLFQNVSAVTIRTADGLSFGQLFQAQHGNQSTSVLVADGEIQCIGTSNCAALQGMGSIPIVDLEGGEITPALTTYGSPMGLEDIVLEESTGDGPVDGNNPQVVRAVDALQFGGRDALVCYRSGISIGIVAPRTFGMISGLSTAFSLGGSHRLERGALVQDIAALHISIDYGQLQWGNTGASVSTQIALLRKLLFEDSGSVWTQKVVSGEIPLVVMVFNADIMATLLELKKEVESKSSSKMQMTFAGAAEAHLLAREIAEADVGVIVIPPRSFPVSWKGRRILSGPPLGEHTLVTKLYEAGVTVGIGPETVGSFVSGSMVRNLRFDAEWIALESKGKISEEEAQIMASVNVERLLGVRIPAAEADLAVTRGGKLSAFSGKVIAMISPRKKRVDIFEE